MSNLAASTRLVLFLRDDPAGPLPWVWLDHSGQAIERGQLRDGEEPAADMAGAPVVAIASGTQVMLASASVPTRNRQKLLQALPYAMEDQLAEDVEALHFALGQRQADGEWAVAVVARAWLDQWLQRLTAMGLTPQRLVPDILCLPLKTDSWCALLHGEVASVRTGNQTGFGADRDNLPMLLETVLDESSGQSPQELRLVYDGPAPTGWSELPLSINAEPMRQPLAWLAAHTDDSQAIDLLQGDYAATTVDRTLLRPWFAVAALFLAWVVVTSGFLWLEQRDLEQRLAALDAAVVESMQEVFPQASDPRQARDRLQSRLNQLQAGGGNQADDGLLDTLRRIGPILQQNEAIRISGLSWRGGNLEIELRGDSLQQLDRLSRDINSADGISAEVRSATSDDDVVSGRLLVRRSSS